jgi:DNA polymerase-3 subunit gamma/tau
LQVTESVQKKYLEQSAKLPLGFLMSALSIGSQLDINYKSSKHQRLHVEIGLLKLSQIQNVLNLSQLPNGDSDEKKNTNSVVQSQSVQTPSIQGSKVEEAPKTYAPAPPTTIPQPENRVVRPESPIRTSSRLKSTIDIELPAAPLKKGIEQVIENKQVIVTGNREFTRQELESAWLEFAESRDNANEQVTLKRSFQLNGTNIHLVLDNQIQQDLFIELKQDLAVFLRQKLQNASIQVTAEIATQEVERRPYSAQEKFEYLAKKNPALWDLKEKLGLDLMF